jgi:hypothetical protein
MFSLSFDSNHRVLLAQFEGVLSSEDIKGMDKALAAFVAHRGLARGILGWTRSGSSWRQMPCLSQPCLLRSEVRCWGPRASGIGRWAWIADCSQGCPSLTPLLNGGLALAAVLRAGSADSIPARVRAPQRGALPGFPDGLPFLSQPRPGSRAAWALGGISGPPPLRHPAAYCDRPIYPNPTRSHLPSRLLVALIRWLRSYAPH